MQFPFDPEQAMQGLQTMWPAMSYQSQVPDRRIPAIEQTWGPWLEALQQNTAGTPKLSAKHGGSIMGPVTGQPQVQQPFSVTPQAASPYAVGGLKNAYGRK